MKFAKLLHNPGAGEGELSKKELVSMIQSAGFGCSYSSTKEKGWEKFEPGEIELIILAGGDGTVRRVAAELLDRKLIDGKLPVAVLPMGTANNIARTLGVVGMSPEDIIASWNDERIRRFDVGRIAGIPGSKFFLESFGFGVFPMLMKKMAKVTGEDVATRDQSLQTALELIRELIGKAEPRFCKLTIDGRQYHGNYLLVEVMNTTSIGPTLQLAPLADPGDGYLDIVLITDSHREQFVEYVTGKLTGKEEVTFYTLLRAKKLEIAWDGSLAHVDDEIIEVKNNKPIKIEVLSQLLEFYVPGETSSNT